MNRKRATLPPLAVKLLVAIREAIADLLEVDLFDRLSAVRVVGARP